jgi:hypothetical protein
MAPWISAIACALALSLATLLVGEAVAAGNSRQKCTAPSIRGATPVTWVCSASEKCCYDWLRRKGVCSASCR